MDIVCYQGLPSRIGRLWKPLAQSRTDCGIEIAVQLAIEFRIMLGVAPADAIIALLAIGRGDAKLGRFAVGAGPNLER